MPEVKDVKGPFEAAMCELKDFPGMGPSPVWKGNTFASLWIEEIEKLVKEKEEVFSADSPGPNKSKQGMLDAVLGELS